MTTAMFFCGKCGQTFPYKVTPDLSKKSLDLYF